MVYIYFVNQKKHHTADGWVNQTHTKTGETDAEAYNNAMHQYHAFLSTYGYGQDSNIDYTSCSVESDTGRILKNEVDDRRPYEPESVEV